MKKLIVRDVVELNNILDKVKLRGVPQDDFNAMMRLCREVEAVATEWSATVKRAMEKLDLKEGDTMPMSEVERFLNEALQDEFKREVEISTFDLSQAAEDAILAQSDITRGQIRAIREIVKKVDE